MSQRTLIHTHTAPNGAVYEVHFDQQSFEFDGEGGLVRNGVDYCGFVSEKGSVTDYDGRFELGKRALLALKAAGFNVDDIRADQESTWGEEQPEPRNDTPSLQNCDDTGTGEDEFHGRG